MPENCSVGKLRMLRAREEPSRCPFSRTTAASSKKSVWLTVACTGSRTRVAGEGMEHLDDSSQLGKRCVSPCLVVL